jgi:hypothetical protein
MCPECLLVQIVFNAMTTFTYFILNTSHKKNNTGSDLEKVESYVSNESNLIKNHTIIANIVRNCVTLSVRNYGH